MQFYCKLLLLTYNCIPDTNHRWTGTGTGHRPRHWRTRAGAGTGTRRADTDQGGASAIGRERRTDANQGGAGGQGTSDQKEAFGGRSLGGRTAPWRGKFEEIQVEGNPASRSLPRATEGAVPGRIVGVFKKEGKGKDTKRRHTSPGWTTRLREVIWPSRKKGGR